MRAFHFCAALLALIVLALPARGADFQEKWVYTMPDLSKDDSVDALVKTMREAKALGCTHVQIKDPQFGFLGMKDEHYFTNVKRVRDAAKEIGIVAIPVIYPFGYSGGYLVQDPNLAAGLPVRSAPFVVKGGVARPDPSAAPKVANAGFDEFSDKKPVGWEVMTGQQFISADTDVKHGGKASLKLSGFIAQLAVESSGMRFHGMESTDARRARFFDGESTAPRMESTEGRLRLQSTGDFAGGRRRRERSGVSLQQTIDVTPFQYYRLTMWVKTDNCKFRGLSVNLTSPNGRRHCYTDIPAPEATQDWKEIQLTFNTLEAKQIEMSVSLSGPTAGTMWIDDLKIEPAGLANLLRRPAKPFVVTSADGKVTYEEGRDFKGVADPLLGKAPARPFFEHFPFDVWHQGPDIVLTSDSRIKDGETILVSYYHPQIIYAEQIIVSMVDPKVFKLMEDQVKRMVDLWHASGYVMNYDEIRIEGWEVSPDGKTYTPGEILARNTTRGVEILRKYAPDATIYTWSDMYDPYHNARSEGVYYLVNGNYAGSWEGLPKDVVIMTWIANARTLKWFADRGHKQILCGYYDSPQVESNINRWLSASQGLPGIVGMMYTTWTNNFTDMEAFFKALDAAQPPAGPAYQGRDETVPPGV